MVSLPVDTAARALRSPVVAGPCSLRKLRRCSRRVAKKASRVGDGHERRPVRASVAQSANAFRAASEIFSSALARDVQRANSPAVNWFWRMYAYCSSWPGLLTVGPLRLRSLGASNVLPPAHRPLQALPVLVEPPDNRLRPLWRSGGNVPAAPAWQPQPSLALRERCFPQVLLVFQPDRTPT